jgi:hypothetical protein
MLEPFISTQWTGDGQIATPDRKTTAITYNVTSSPKKITFTITDAGGTTASATIGVDTPTVYKHAPTP